MIKRGSALAGNLNLHVRAGAGKTGPGRAVSGRAFARGLLAVLEIIRLYSAPRILGVECLPAGNAPLSGKDHLQGQGVPIP
jgi:hypothetical protein